MATYGYRAITKAGKEVKGSLEADNKDLAMAELRRQELTVIDLGEQSFLTKDIDIQIGGWPKARDLSVMCRQFVSMTKAGVSILESLKMLCEQTENKRLQDALKEVRISVEKGETLADSMAEHPKVFPAIMVNMVAAGEASGSLETATRPSGGAAGEKQQDTGNAEKGNDLSDCGMYCGYNCHDCNVSKGHSILRGYVC
ncbi:MAG: type II secretion system F family protein [Lachnospiraceae bacterium]